MKKITGKKLLPLLALTAILGAGMASPARADDDHAHGPEGYHHDDRGRGEREHWEHEHWEHEHREWEHRQRHWVYDWRVRRYVLVPVDYMIPAPPVAVVVPPPTVVYEEPRPVYMAPQPPPFGMNMVLHIR
ncbi:MAG: hypothetical protein P4M15_13835 [Alphaproteobacteria bacterium]|nr:hypothetical protein [Alphaproteobacteria bacterium]